MAGVIGGERFVGATARASGGEAHDCLTETFAAVPPRRLRTSVSAGADLLTAANFRGGGEMHINFRGCLN
jgi:hypothetical protein